MKVSSFIFCLTLVTMGVGTIYARSAGDQGYGLVVGAPSGVSAKFWFSNIVALDAAFGAAQGDLEVHADFLFHDYDILRTHFFPNLPSNIDLPIYIGMGPRVLFHDKEEFGIRFPVGVSVIPKDTPWEFFTELSPIVRFTPDTGVNFDFGIGARYYFEAIRPRQ